MQAETNQRLSDMQAAIHQLEDRMDKRFVEMNQRLSDMQGEMNQRSSDMQGSMHQLEDRMDKRFVEMNQRLSGMQSETNQRSSDMQGEMNQRLRDVHGEIRNVRLELGKLNQNHVDHLTHHHPDS